MRRLLAVLISSFAMTVAMLSFPVLADTGPEPEPVSSAVEELPLGSVDAPADEAEVQQGATEPVPGLEATPTLTLTQADTEEFSAVGVTWVLDPAVVDIVLKVRVQDAGGVWSAWTEIGMDDVGSAPNPDAAAAGDQRGGSEPYWSGPSFGVELEVLTRSGATPQDVQLVLIDPREADADSVPLEPEIQDMANAGAATPPIYSRAQWGADESIMGWDPDYAGTLKAATVHHTADANGYSESDVPRILRSIYYFHSVSRGWGDIGYNVIADRFGRLWEGRTGGLASTVIGAHAGGFNTSTFGVSMLGNYDVVDTPQAMINSVAAVIAWKFGLYGVNPSGSTRLTSGGGGTAKYPAGAVVDLPTIFGHRDVGNTTCPGRYGYARMDEIRARVAAYGTTPPDASGAGVSAAVASTGQTTVFVRGSGAALYYRTSQSSGGFGGWAQVPGGLVTSAPAVVSYGTAMELVVRGSDGGYYGQLATFDGQGRPSQWHGWYSLGGGGVFSSAPAIASAGPNMIAVVGRGTDGGLWQANWAGSRFSGWASLGGVSYSAPTLHAQVTNGVGRYTVSTLGMDNRVWQVDARTSTPGLASNWTVSGFTSSVGPQTNPASLNTPGPGAITTATSSAALMITDAGTGRTINLGGLITSTAAIARQGDGSIWAFARGSNQQLWLATWNPTTGASGWWLLGGYSY